MFIGYARVSTRKQSLKAQKAKLKEAVHFYNEKHHTKKRLTIYAEKKTGKTTNRPQFKAMIKALHKNDVVLLVRLDRFARNIREALNSLHAMKKKGVTVRVLQPYPVTLNDKNEMVVDNLLMFAQMERKAILNRTRIGKMYKKEECQRKGVMDFHWKGGHPHRLNNAKNARYYLDMYKFFKSPKHSARQTAKAYGCTPKTVYNVNHQMKRDWAYAEKLVRGE